MKNKADRLNPDEKKYIHTEGIDYSKTGDESIWGPGDRDTLTLLKKIDIHGTWLNLAAGDGRYNVNLLKEADVVASDLDESALRKLWHTTPEEYRTKLTITVFDITERFPFKDESFDGVFCASTLHYFPEEVLRNIFGEIDRILKKNGRILVEFATDMNRIYPDGQVYIRESEPLYTFGEAVSFLNQLLNLYEVHITASEVPPEHVKTERFEYTLSCKLIILMAEKR
jgi:SAM-dependent methyltransferase